jgi:predicted Zn-dependent peptidase
MYDPYAEFRKSVLPNGLEVHSQFWDRPWICVEIVIHSGAREDPVVLPGLAHFVEHLVSQNIPGRKHESVEEFIDIVGGKANFGTTSYVSTRYMFSVPADLAIFREALGIFGGMLLEARLEKDIDRERRVINREFNQKYPSKEHLEWNMAARTALFKGHRIETYNRPLGRPQGFLFATQADLQGFYDSHYVPANMSLAVVGGLQTNELLVELERSPFGMHKEGKRVLIPKPLLHLPTPTEQAKTVKLSDYTSLTVDKTEYRSTWAFPASFPWKARVVFSRVLNEILSEEIRRKRSLCYGINTIYQDFQDVIEFGICGQISPEATAEIDNLVRGCISMVSSSNNYFTRKLKSCIEKCRLVDVSGSELADEAADELASDHRIIPTKEDLEGLQKVTFDQMTEAASFLSPERQYTFIACP